MAEVDSSVETLLSRAKEQERTYDWVGASRSYEEALASSRDNGSDRDGEFLERLAYATSKSAFQASTHEEFRQTVGVSIGLFRKTIEALRKQSGQRSLAIAARCDAMCSYLGYWLETDNSKKRECMKAAWEVTKDALSKSSVSKDFPNLVLTYNRLHLSAILTWNYEEVPEARSTILTELVEYGNQVAENLDSLEHLKEESARALVNLGSSRELLIISVPPSAEEARRKSDRTREDLARAMKLSEEATTCEAVYSCLSLGDILDLIPSLCRAEEEKFLRLGRGRLIDFAESSRDRLLQGLAYSDAVGHLDWMAACMEIREDAERLFNLALDHSAEVRRHFACLGFIAPDFGWTPWPSVPASPWYYWRLSRLETDLVKKRDLISRSLDEARDSLRYAESSGYPLAVGFANYPMALALETAADLENDDAKRRAMLQEALRYWDGAIKADDTYCPGHLWNRGISRAHRAEIEYKLVQLMGDGEDKAIATRSSASHLKQGLELMSDWAVADVSDGSKTRYSALGLFWNRYGRALRAEFEIVGNRDVLRAAVDAYEKAAKEAVKGDLLSHAAEDLWEAARTYDMLDEHVKSSRKFEEASRLYAKAAQKIRALSEYYQGYAAYMRAWSEVEKARHSHSRQEPFAAREHYRTASELHSTSKQWSYLSINYSALAELENAEDLSQKEEFKDSMKSFGEAARLFSESRKRLNEHFGEIDSTDEREMVSHLIEATEIREEFCAARSALEEARQLDKRGEMCEASERYAQVAEMFQAMLDKSASEPSRREIGLITTLVNAWRAMSRAEAEASPELYEEAARLFEQAKNASPGERAKNLTLGHSRFCKALGLGARFADSGDSASYHAATDSLESAARYYMKAGFDKASEYARASKLLFDAYAHMGIASKEHDPHKKVRDFAVSEKLLEAAAKSYEKAGQSGKNEQVLRMLERAKQERQLAFSLTQVFIAPDEASNTAAFSSPSLSQEKAVGLDRFEHANVMTTLTAKPKTVNVGEDIVLDIEFVNAGRGLAQLMKVDQIIPGGFDVVSEPEKCRMEDHCLDLRGRMLNALRTEELRLVLRPTVQGRFQLKPRVMYLDDSGKYRLHEPEPVEVTVKEMGISGWLKGPDSRR